MSQSKESVDAMKLRCDESMTDEELIAAFYNGSDRAFDLLHSRYQPKICAWLATRTNFVWTRAEDLTQNTFIKVNNTRYSLTARFRSGGASFRTWLYRIAFHVLLADQRAYKRESSVDGVIIERLQSNHTTLSRSSPSGPLGNLLGNDDRIAFFACLQRLHGIAQTIFHLLTEGFQQNEIAEIVGKTTVQVNRIKFRSLAVLRKCLDGNEGRGIAPL